jgi:hypothetical protein
MAWCIVKHRDSFGLYLFGDKYRSSAQTERQTSCRKSDVQQATAFHRHPIYPSSLHFSLLFEGWHWREGITNPSLTYIITYWLHGAGYYLRSWLSLSLSKNILLSYGTRRFITVYTQARHWALSWASWIQLDPYLPKVHLNVISPTPRFSQWSLAFGPPNQNPVNTSPLPRACHMSRPPHRPWFNHPNNIRWIIQAVKLIIMQFSPLSVFFPFRSKHLPQHSLLKNL